MIVLVATALVAAAAWVALRGKASEGAANNRSRAVQQVLRVFSGLVAAGGVYGVIFELNRDEIYINGIKYGGPSTNTIFVCVGLVVLGVVGVWQTTKKLTEE